MSCVKGWSKLGAGNASHRRLSGCALNFSCAQGGPSQQPLSMGHPLVKHRMERRTKVPRGKYWEGRKDRKFNVHASWQD